MRNYEVGRRITKLGLSERLLASNRAAGQSVLGGPVYGLDVFFKVELYALHTAYIVILITWLYRHVRKELKRKD